MEVATRAQERGNLDLRGKPVVSAVGKEARIDASEWVVHFPRHFEVAQTVKLVRKAKPVGLFSNSAFLAASVGPLLLFFFDLLSLTLAFGAQ